MKKILLILLVLPFSTLAIDGDDWGDIGTVVNPALTCFGGEDAKDLVLYVDIETKRLLQGSKGAHKNGEINEGLELKILSFEGSDSVFNISGMLGQISANLSTQALGEAVVGEYHLQHEEDSLKLKVECVLK